MLARRTMPVPAAFVWAERRPTATTGTSAQPTAAIPGAGASTIRSSHAAGTQSGVDHHHRAGRHRRRDHRRSAGHHRSGLHAGLLLIGAKQGSTGSSPVTSEDPVDIKGAGSFRRHSFHCYGRPR